MIFRRSFTGLLTSSLLGLVSFVLFLASTASVHASTPPAINTQVRLRDSASNVVSSTVTIQFSLYTSASGGSPSDSASASGALLWKETYDGSSGTCPQITPDAQGYFSVGLSSCLSFPSYLTFNTTSLYLGVKVGTDPEMSPRLSLGSSPFALNSQTVNGFNASSTATAGALLALDSLLGYNIGVGAFTGGSLSLTSSTITSTIAGNLQVSGSANLTTTTVANLSVSNTSTLNGPTLLNSYAKFATAGTNFLYFNNDNLHYLTWNSSASQFAFSHDLTITGNATSSIFHATTGTFDNLILNGSLNINSSTFLTVSTTNIFATSATFTNIVWVNATSTNLNTANLVSSNATSTNLNTTNLTSTNATTTNSSITNGTITNLIATNATSTNFSATVATFTSVTSTNQNVTNLTFANATGTNANFTNLVATNATSTNLNSTNIAGTNLLVTNATTTNLSATNAVLTSVTSTNGAFTTLSVTNPLNLTNLTWTNATGTNSLLTNVTSTNLNVTGNTTLANATTTNFAATLASITSATLGSATSTNFTTTNFVSTNATSTNVAISNLLSVSGTSTLATTTIANLTVSATTTLSGNLVISGMTAGSILFASTSGQISQNNSQFFWNTINNRLGVGTSTPVAKLSIVSDATTDPFDIASSTSPTNTIFRVKADGKIGIGTSTPAQTLSVVGSIGNLIDPSTPIFQIATSSSGFSSGGAYDLAVVGRYAYVVNTGLTIYDISSPGQPVIIATTSVGISSPIQIEVFGRYAYITENSLNKISVFDISNPKNPQFLGSSPVDSTGTAPRTLAIGGKYAYVGDYYLNQFTVIDISNPAAPSVTATLTIKIGTASQQSIQGGIALAGRYVYLTERASSTLAVIDVGNPAAPVVVGNVTVGSLPSGVAVSGRYAYVTNQGSGTLSVVDVSDPTNPLQVATTSIGTPGTFSGYPFIAGRYVYIENSSSKTLTIVDVSSSTLPQTIRTVSQIGTTPIAGVVSGKNIYLVNQTDGSFSVVDIAGTELSNLLVHSAEIGSLQARNDVTVQGTILANTSLMVGAGGINSNGALAINTTNTPSYFNDQVGIGTNTPAVALQVVGDIRVGTGGTNGCLQRFDGTALAGTCVSDRRLKKDIQSFDNVLDRLAQLTPVTYNFRADEFPDFSFGSSKQYGLIAQDVKPLFPELVADNVKDGFMGINYHLLPIYILQGLKELDLKVSSTILSTATTTEDLQAQITGLKTWIEEQFSNIPSSTTNVSFTSSSLLALIQNATLPQLTVTNLVVKQAADFQGTLVVAGHVEFGGDSVGQAKILAGFTTVTIPFATPYDRSPIVVATPVEYGGAWQLTGVSSTQFNLALFTTSTRDVLFNWYAFMPSAEAQVVVSKGVIETSTIIVVEPTASSSLSVPPVESVSSTVSSVSSTPADPSTTSSTLSVVVSSTPSVESVSSTPAVSSTPVVSESSASTTPSAPVEPSSTPVADIPPVSTTPSTPEPAPPTETPSTTP